MRALKVGSPFIAQEQRGGGECVSEGSLVSSISSLFSSVLSCAWQRWADPWGGGEGKVARFSDLAPSILSQEGNG